MSTIGKRSDGPFDWPMISDPRVNADLKACLVCHEPLRTFTSTDSGVILMAAQCHRCNRIYILGGMQESDIQ